MFFVVGCSKQPHETWVPESPESHPDHFTAELEGTWPPTNYTRVVGYRFDYPEGINNPGILYGNYEQRKARLNHHGLAKLTRAACELSPKQAKRLLFATFSSSGHTGFGGCYHPHHIFVFYRRDKPTHVIEVCFSCYGIIIAPYMPNSEEDPCMDLADTALLCSELGLWFDDGTAQEYSNDLKEQFKWREEQNPK